MLTQVCFVALVAGLFLLAQDIGDNKTTPASDISQLQNATYIEANDVHNLLSSDLLCAHYVPDDDDNDNDDAVLEREMEEAQSESPARLLAHLLVDRAERTTERTFKSIQSTFQHPSRAFSHSSSSASSPSSTASPPPPPQDIGLKKCEHVGVNPPPSLMSKFCLPDKIEWRLPFNHKDIVKVPVCLDLWTMLEHKKTLEDVLPSLMSLYGREQNVKVHSLTTLDDFVKIKWVMRLGIQIIEGLSHDKNLTKNLSHSHHELPPINKAMLNSLMDQSFTFPHLLAMDGKLHFAPASEATTHLIAWLNTTYPLFGLHMLGSVWPSEDEMTSFLSKSDEPSWAAVIVNSLTEDNFDVKLRFNQTATPLTSSQFIIQTPYAGGTGREGNTSIQGYFTSGFIAVQTAVVTYWQTQLLKMPYNASASPNLTGEEKNAPYQPILAPMPFSSFDASDFLGQVAGSTLPMLFVISFLYPVGQLARNIVYEKEARIREAMLIMGLGQMTFYFSWVLTYMVLFAVPCIISTLICCLTFFAGTNPLIIFLAMYLFSVSGIFFAAAMSTFFSSAKVCAFVAPVIYFLLAIPSFVIKNSSTVAVRKALLLLGPGALQHAFTLIGDHAISGGFQWEQINSQEDDINMAFVFGMFVLDAILYALIALYFDAVFPSEWGHRRHPLFFVIEPYRWFVKRRKIAAASSTGVVGFYENDRDGRDTTGFYEVYGENSDSVAATKIEEAEEITAQESRGEDGEDGAENPNGDDEIQKRGKKDKKKKKKRNAEGNATALEIKGLRKVFQRGGDEFRAVDDLHMTLRRNEVTVLLGQNGAGKTTTINMITGLLQPDKGDCVFYPKAKKSGKEDNNKETTSSGGESHRGKSGVISLQESLSEMRQRIAFCPQHNILWDNLTCVQHLEYYAALKGITGKKQKRVVMEMLTEVDLMAHRHKAAKKLSGGMKRKLSVAIAFVTGSEFVLLDEPTAGMDVGARRHTWDLIKRMSSKGRAILLTTHYMDEADLLGDKVSMMATGRMRCEGSPSFLKQKYSVGYTLTCSVDKTAAAAASPVTAQTDEQNGDETAQAVAVAAVTPPSSPASPADTDPHKDDSKLYRHLKALVEANNNGGRSIERLVTGSEEVAFRLPTQSAAIFPQLLAPLEEDPHGFGLRGFGISITTLEEVFLKIATAGATAADAGLTDSNSKNKQLTDRTAADTEDLSTGVVAVKDGDVHHGGEEILSVNGGGETEPDQKDRLLLREDHVVNVNDHQAIMNDEHENDDDHDGVRPPPTIQDQFRALFMKRLRYMVRDRRAQFCQTVLPVSVLLFFNVLLLINFIPYQPALVLNGDMYASKGLHNPAMYVGGAKDCTQRFSDQINPDYRFVDINATDTIEIDDGKKSETYQNITLFAETMQNSVYNHDSKNSYRPMAIFCGANVTEEPTTNTRDVLFYNYSSFHAVPEVLHTFFKSQTETYIREQQQGRTGTRTTPRMKMSVQPFPLNHHATEEASETKAFLLAILILVPLSFIPSTYAAWVVKERQIKGKHLQSVSGMNHYAYWITTLILDSGTYFITLSLIFIIFAIFKQEVFISSAAAGPAFCLFLFYGLAGITNSYALSFFFDDHSSAQNKLMVFNVAAGFLLTLVSWVLHLIDATKDKWYTKTCPYIFQLLPPFSLGNGIIALATANLESQLLGRAPDYWKWAASEDGKGDFSYGLSYPVLYLAISFPVYFLIAVAVDHPARRRYTQALSYKPNAVPPAVPDENPDVTAERQRIAEGVERLESSTDAAASEMSDNVVVVENLRKVYEAKKVNCFDKFNIFGKNTKNNKKGTGKVAVKNLTFGVKKNEVFGFLGTNGAGKTTAISVICGEMLATMGKAFVKGYDVVTDLYAAQRHIGYCPQFDALFDLLTIEEHLNLYATLRGIKPSGVPAAVARLVDVFELHEYKNTYAKNLSGGNRRKLSVAIAMVGRPSVVFLDEPSAGLDPVARRRLWDVIDTAARQSAIILTTHHLEEVEALAHRLAIMVDGQLECIGDKTHLKQQYGAGFELTVRLNHEDDASPLEMFMKENIPVATLQESRGVKFTYSVPRGGEEGESEEGPKLSTMFHLLEQNKTTLNISDYTISQTSIESVFLRIAENYEYSA